MSDAIALLTLLRLTDSAFPVGGFAHSSGLEQLVHDGLVADASGAERFVRSVIIRATGTSDAIAAAVAVRAASDGDCATIFAADSALFVMKASSEMRSASSSMGQRLLREVAVHVHAPVLDALARSLRKGGTPGTYAVLFGASAGALGVAPDQAAAALMHTTATSILHAAMRLLPVSHRDVQGALHRLQGDIARLAHHAASCGLDDMTSFHPFQDIASMRHRTAPMRLFAS